MSSTARGRRPRYTLYHWGVYEVEDAGTGRVRLIPLRSDPAPSEIGIEIHDDSFNATRVRKPAIRAGWLERGRNDSARRRGEEPFVEVDWPTATELVARELQRVRSEFGNPAIFAGSYGWASAGRFHHAQSQLHRFLNLFGGYVRHVDTYSLGAGRVIMPHILAPLDELIFIHTSWDVVVAHTELFVAFGGVPAKNSQVSPGGASDHRVGESLRQMSRRGVRLVNISPVSDNMDRNVEAEWIAIRPNTDTALMLGIAYTLHQEGLWDEEFVRRCAVGFDRFAAYLTGEKDGTPKTPHWASAITGVAEDTIRNLARDMASHRTMINVAWALQRAAHGEQPFWMATTLAAMLGQIGLPGGGLGVGYGASNTVGSSHPLFSGPTLDRGSNPVKAFIPVARIADMLLNPGESFHYNGGTHCYPDIRLVYWAGGNPFHHHQNLQRLTEAWKRPETIIVHEPFWTATAKMADIVLPVSVPLERNDIGFAKREGVLVAMQKCLPDFASARSDYAIFHGIAQRLGFQEAFSEGRDEMGWLRTIYEDFRVSFPNELGELPGFDHFWEEGLVDFRHRGSPVVMLADFREAPDANPLKTPSGKIEIFSSTIAGFGYADCPGHPVWLEPPEWSGSPKAARWPIHLLTDQPKYRLHSQLDHASSSRKGKVRGREPVYINPRDARRRGIADGDLVEIFNGRGRCIAAAIVSDEIAAGVARISTGAWYDPGQDAEGFIEKHGNPNALTLDHGASQLSQGCSAQTCLVELRRYAGEPPGVTAFKPPALLEQ